METAYTAVDCNDTNHTVNPWAKEDRNYIDEDRDGRIDEEPNGPDRQLRPDVLGASQSVGVHDDANCSHPSPLHQR